MVVLLTDEQIVEVFDLCSEIVDVRKTMPMPPRGMNTSLELARNLRSTLEKHNDALVQLGALLRVSRSDL